MKTTRNHVPSLIFPVNYNFNFNVVEVKIVQIEFKWDNPVDEALLLLVLL